MMDKLQFFQFLLPLAMFNRGEGGGLVSNPFNYLERICRINLAVELNF